MTEVSEKNSMNLDEKVDNVEKLENLDRFDSADPILQKFPRLLGKSADELARLNKVVLRKLDFRFLPFAAVALLMSYLDRINVSNARLAGMQKDLGNMSDTTWSTGISLYYVGYMISQVPANVFLAKGNPRILMPLCILSWAVVTTCMTAVTTSWAFILCRFLVGLMEGPFFPSVSLMSAVWYTKEELPMRTSIWHAGTTLSNVVSSLLAAGILTNMDGIAGMFSWQWLLLIEGLASISVALAGFWFLPSWPGSTGSYYFTAEESEMSQYRLLVSAGYQTEDEGGYWEGSSLAIRDPLTWMYTALHFFIIISEASKDFFPSIMDTLGFSKIQTYLIQAPPWIIAYIFTLLGSWTVTRVLNIGWHIHICALLTLAGAILMICTLHTGARYFALVLLCCGPPLALNLMLVWETTNIPTPRTKRAAVIAIANAASSVTRWVTPYAFLTEQAPRYGTGGAVIMAGCGGTVGSVLVLWWWCGRRNRVLKGVEDATGVLAGFRFVY